MFGLLLLLLVGIWAAACLWVAARLARWALKAPVGETAPRFSVALRVGLALPAFVAFLLAPVVDEIVSIPSMRSLCAKADEIEIAPNSSRTPQGTRAVYYVNAERHYLSLPGSKPIDAQSAFSGFIGAVVRLNRGDYVDSATKERVFSIYSVDPVMSTFALPNAGGGRTPMILTRCQLTDAKRRVDLVMKDLSLVKIETP